MKKQKQLWPIKEIILPIYDSLYYSGCNPLKNSILSNIIWAYLLVSLTTWLILAVVKLYNTTEKDMFIKVVLSIQGIGQTLSIVIVGRVNRKILLNIQDTLENHFWFHEIEKNLSLKHKKHYKSLRKFILGYQAFILGAVISVLTEPIFKSERRFALDMQFPFKNFIIDSPAFEIVYLLQVITFSPFTAVFFDAIYIVFVAFALIQIDALKYKIKILSDYKDEKEIYHNLKECIAHHNIIMGFIWNVDTLFKYVLFGKVFSAMVVVIGYLFLLRKSLDQMQNGLNYEIIANMLVILGYCSQSFFYCMCGDIVTRACESIGEIAYNVKWEKVGNKSVTSALAMIIMRSQREVILTAGGMMNFSLSNYVAMLKSVFSYYVILKNMDNM